MGDDVSGRKRKRPLKGASVGFAARHPAASDVIARERDLQTTYARKRTHLDPAIVVQDLGVARS